MNNIDNVVSRLRSGIKFGIFGYEAHCYFQDGFRAGYNDLWKAVRIVNGIEGRPCKRLAEEFPSAYVGSFAHKYTRHVWK